MSRTRRRASCWAAGALWACSALAAQGPDAESAYRRGVDALRARDYADAVQALEQALELDPGNADAWFKLGQSRSGLKNSVGAIEAYRRVIDLEPQNARALNNLANGLFRMGRYEESAEWYGRALEIDPDYVKATFHYGWVLRHLERPAEAEQVFRRCLELEPTREGDRAKQLDCYYYLGALRFRAGDYARTASIMEEVLEYQPAHVEARYYLGMSYRHLGRIEDAARQLELHRKLLEARRGPSIER